MGFGVGSGRSCLRSARALKETFGNDEIFQDWNVINSAKAVDGGLGKVCGWNNKRKVEEEGQRRDALRCHLRLLHSFSLRYTE